MPSRPRKLTTAIMSLRNSAASLIERVPGLRDEVGRVGVGEDLDVRARKRTACRDGPVESESGI